MAIMIGITKKGVKDICIVGHSYEEGRELIDLFNSIEAEVHAFEDVINQKLHPAHSDMEVTS